MCLLFYYGVLKFCIIILTTVFPKNCFVLCIFYDDCKTAPKIDRLDVIAIIKLLIVCLFSHHRRTVSPCVVVWYNFYNFCNSNFNINCQENMKKVTNIGIAMQISQYWFKNVVLDNIMYDISHRRVNVAELIISSPFSVPKYWWSLNNGNGSVIPDSF